MPSTSGMKYVVLGGGIAGTTVAENLPHFTDQPHSITLISASSTVKRAVNVKPVSEVIESFDVVEGPADSSYNFIHAAVQGVDYTSKTVYTSTGPVQYDRLCIALGARPNVLYPDLRNVFGIRDTHSVQNFNERLQHCSHITVVGNGGIASELVHATHSCQITWVIRDESVSSVFVDAVASQFLLKSREGSVEGAVVKRHVYTPSTGDCLAQLGSALGPDWYKGVALGGAGDKGLSIEYSSDVTSIEELSNHTLQVTLSTGKVLHTDAVVSATGVTPNTQLFTSLHLAPDQGIVVDNQMKTSEHDVYAAGDVCTIPWSDSRHWKQMRLWTQARQQGFYTARCMASTDEELPDITFDLFTHSTKLFGYKVILLGQYMEYPGCQCYFRITEGVEFVKVVVEGGRVHGALLIGETDLEEMLENLILNQLDISDIGEDLLDPNIDIEDYFD